MNERISGGGAYRDVRIGRRIYDLRGKEGLTRRAFAERVGTSVDDLEAMESGRMGTDGIEEGIKREFAVGPDFFTVDAPANDERDLE